MSEPSVMDIVFSNNEVTEQWIEGYISDTETAFREVSRRLYEYIGETVQFDEVALIVPDAYREYLFLEALVRVGGWQFTAAAFDSVKTGPIPSNYEVHYSFLTSPARNWRMEVMRILHGHSPVHYGAREKDLVTMHYSFKTPDERSYEATLRLLADNGWRLAQMCDSTYGRFSYWRPPALDPTDSLVYVKPRVNLRDAE